jgi:hypothetical protein
MSQIRNTALVAYMQFLSLEKKDRLDKNLAEVVVQPKKFLKGPFAQVSGYFTLSITI